MLLTVPVSLALRRLRVWRRLPVLLLHGWLLVVATLVERLRRGDVARLLLG